MTSNNAPQIRLYRVSYMEIRPGVNPHLGATDVNWTPLRTREDSNGLRDYLREFYNRPALEVTGWSRYDD